MRLYSPKTSSPATVCVMATGDMGQKQNRQTLMQLWYKELEKFATNKRESRKFINKYDFFGRHTSHAIVGKTLGQFRTKRKNATTSSI